MKPRLLRVAKQEVEVEEPDIEQELSEEEVEKNISEIYDPSAYDPDLLPPYVIYEPLDYRDGPEGFIKWCEDCVCIPIYPEGSDIAVWVKVKDLSSDIHPKSGKSYDYIWQMQKEEIRKCLRMVNGRFIYRLIILSWMRGEGKSLLACLIQLWKFFNWPKQQIVLGANSKDQVKFVHYDIMREIVNNSPVLLNIIGERNVQEKEIRLRDAEGKVSSVLRAISSFSGIVSNITGYTFSEIFDMKNPKFFTQLDGSIRNIPNALGVIDSTVSPKTHVLYKMYQAFVTRATKTLFFSYRCSPQAQIEDYWNPNMDQQQLDDYKAKFPLGDFEKYFMNVWGSNAQQVFDEPMLESTNYLGLDGHVSAHSDVMEVVNRKLKLKETVEELLKKNVPSTFENELSEINALQGRLYPVEKVYVLRDKFGVPCSATLSDLDKLSELYDTNWAILAGIDRSDPLKKDRSAARTIVTIVAKGLSGSRSNFLAADNGNPLYIYAVLNVVHVADSTLEGIKEVLIEAHEQFDGIDALCGERWGLWDITSWCETEDIALELIHPSYDKQKAAFSELHGAISGGRFKCPPLAVAGSKGEDIFKEEAGVFFHDEDKRWFGSPEKGEKYGTQDDFMFSTAWCVYGGRELKSDSFKERNQKLYFGTMVINRNLLSSSIKTVAKTAR